MIDTKHETSKRRKSGNIWGELAKLCNTIHDLLYQNGDKASAKPHAAQLRQLLEALPENDLAVLREEGLALLNELENESGAAIRHRKREIQLIRRLHESVNSSIEAGDYDRGMGLSILAD